MTSEVRPCISRVERHLHQALVLGVERAGGLVEEQQRGVAQDRARDRDPLPLAAGQAHALLAEEGGEALRQAVEELGGGGRLGGGADLGVAGVGPAVADVGRGVGREDHRLLRHQADPGAIGARGSSSVIGTPSNRMRPRSDRSSASGAGRRWSCRRRKGRPGPRSRPGATSRSKRPDAGSGCDGIGEAHPSKRQRAGGWRRQRRRRGRRGDLGRRVEQLEQALGGAGGALQVAEHVAEAADGAGDDGGVEHERRTARRR